jgi:hypothetical protein
MITRIGAALVLAVLALGGCSSRPAPEIVVVAAEPPRPVYPAECNPARDRGWQDLPDADVRRAELARNYAANRAGLRKLAASRRVCWAGLKAHAATAME